MVPILKWAGGKTQLLSLINANVPSSFNRYYEPFIGGGAVLLSLRPRDAVINDTNKQLINMYKQVRDNPDDVLQFIKSMDVVLCDKDYYYDMRSKFNHKITYNELDAECAALMIWLNKHCFNGLYRVNSKGLFNVPYNNRKSGNSVDEDDLRDISTYLRHNQIAIMCCDFEEACDGVKAGDFVYFDSPYIPVSDTADFTDYTKEGFFLKDHQRLADLFKNLDSIGAHLMLSSSNVPMIHTLYDGFNIQSFNVKRMINRDVSKRVGEEVLITNY